MVIPQTEIIIRKDGAEVARRVVEPGEYLIGRGEDCAFQVIGEKVSRHHARLFVSFQDWSVADLGSANGTHLNDEPVGEAAVKVWPSQIIRVGDATIELRALAPGDPDASLMPTQETVRRHLPPELQGQRRYQVGKQVAQGGMGAILDALDVSTRRNVAMKVMLNVTDPGDVLRFIEEAQVTAQLEHPNIVPVHELSVNEQGEVFYTMKMVKGVTLKKVLELLTKSVAATVAKYPLPVLLTIFQKVCDAIAFAHSKGVIHRDLKPENIMLGDYGEVLVMDWGLARLVGSAERATVVRTAKADEGDAMRTQTGSIMGTPAYMSPEQARGEIEKLDARSDIYALGTILFELLHLRPAVTGAEVMQIVSKVQRGEIEWTPKSAINNRQSPIPESLLAVCRKALALSARDRYARIEDLQADLLAYQNGFATSAENAGAWRQLTLFVRRNKAATIGAAAVLLIGGTLGTKAIIEGRRAEQALANLRRSAPVFAEQARSLAAQQQFADALARIDAALAIAPDDAAFHFERASLLQVSDRFEEASEAFARAKRLNASLPQLSESMALNERLLSETANSGEISTALLTDWLKALQSANRTGEALTIAQRAKTESSSQLPILQARLDAWLGKDAPKIKMRDRNLFALELKGLAISDLSPLEGLPLHYLNILGIPFTDLTPLKDMPLRELHIGSPRVCDLSPLADSKIEHLSITYCGKVDLRPVKNWPLKTLNINGTHVNSLEPLRGKLMTEIQSGNSGISDLEPLRGMPLTTLILGGSPVSSLEPLAGMPLRELDLGTKSVDISPLSGLPIESLSVGSVGDLTPLLSCPKLRRLRRVRDHPSLEKLRAHPSLQFISYSHNHRPAAEFWAEYDAKAK